MVYRQDPGTGRLTPNDPPWGQTHLGGSPRHLAFAPSGRYLFANGEADLTLSLFRYDPVRGLLDHIQHVRTVPDGVDTRRHSTAQMLVHPNGRFVYVANRGTRYDRRLPVRRSRGADRVHRPRTQREAKRPATFRSIRRAVGSTSANQNSDRIERFAIDQETGRLSHQGCAADVPAPTCIQFTSDDGTGLVKGIRGARPPGSRGGQGHLEPECPAFGRE